MGRANGRRALSHVGGRAEPRRPPIQGHDGGRAEPRKPPYSGFMFSLAGFHVFPNRVRVPFLTGLLINAWLWAARV